MLAQTCCRPVDRLLNSLVVSVLLMVSMTGCGGPDAATPATNTAEVAVAQGTLQGLVKSSYRAFLGIPYAAPPVGDLRWSAPQAPASWSGVRAATQFGNRCAQFATPLGNADSSDEDCLYLNVYTPIADDSSRPVMVWLHGGTYTIGAGSDYDGSVLSSVGDVVLVTVNYRLGPFGYFALPELEKEDPNHSTGDYGLLDQQAALRWVQANIAQFGGDPGNVTVFGESAGAWSVCSHLVSPLSQGLFSKAIMESGPCASAPVNTMKKAESFGSSFAARAPLNCTGTAKAILACMRSKSVDDIKNAETYAEAQATSGDFIPAVEGYSLTQEPETAIEAGAFAKIPVILGANHDEGKLFVALIFDVATPPQRLDATNYSDSVYQLLSTFNSEFALVGNFIMPAILQQYPLSNYPAPVNYDPAQTPAHMATAAVIGDAGFICPVLPTDEAVAGAGVPVYSYQFSDPHPPIPPQIAADPYLPPPLAGHAAELEYVFQAPIDNGAVNPSMLTPAQIALSSHMQKYWTNFAKTGNPNGDGLTDWPQFSGKFGELLNLTTTGGGASAITTSDFKNEHDCAFWGLLGA